MLFAKAVRGLRDFVWAKDIWLHYPGGSIMPSFFGKGYDWLMESMFQHAERDSMRCFLFSCSEIWLSLLLKGRLLIDNLNYGAYDGYLLTVMWPSGIASLL
ncbi:hypothetical protein NC653_009667 [Populus alba x Populus x berolinensis]|uniref:Uncharacterized protein n=1 Tax=Populus alba x Populus x berolinensis TaxID=444605 RepID=A0AAD6RA45_9ROSI|nr:hypothetical protein NC653_009667 [Populus alba x Populus x berolinensis]